ncbi:hypothetical protein [Streptomyces fildesensis]|uniref:hypothetical protein n=1 Tax=Streptomyces fildesensis TaxID=375757 RepID=UPI0018E058A4|nr:hypothetical protein [Streptomyces fildesensis]
MRTWPVRRWAVATVVAAVAAIVIGVPTGIIHTSLYTRMTPVLWWNYPAWLLSSMLEGLLVATYVRVGEPAEAEASAAPPPPRTARALGAGALSAFAVGCPICNKLVVLALGVSGALSYFAPVQPVLAVASLALLGHALVRRIRTASACALPLRFPRDAGSGD